MHENKSTPLIHSKLIDHCSAEDNNYNVRQESCRARSHIFDWTMCERSWLKKRSVFTSLANSNIRLWKTCVFFEKERAEHIINLR